ncbi:MAG: hypothetical protein JWP45_2157 [Mucilaginibacter sp.]|nr:hypothetical protein [Mucilaginibacter sp.]
MTLIAISLSSCLKDKTYLDFPNAGNIVNMPLSGVANFGADAVTADTAVIKFAVDYATANANPALTVTLAVDTTLVAKYNAANTAITYFVLPASAYVFTGTKVSIAAGAQYAFTTITINKYLLDPSKSYMLPVVIKDAQGVAISANQSIHYYHVIGNDFAGAYTWDYRRYNNGTGPGTNPNGSPAIPSLGQGGPTSAGTSLGQAGQIVPVSPTEFQMITGYNGEKVAYDVTFTKSVDASGVAHYSNWNVTFPAAELAKWTTDGITNSTPPKFTIPPPATGSDPKIFEMNYVSGAASPRYIDDTYHK